MSKSIGIKIYEAFMNGYSVETISSHFKRSILEVEDFIRKWSIRVTGRTRG